MNDSTDPECGYQPAIKVHSPAPKPTRHGKHAPTSFLPLATHEPKKPRQAEIKPER